MKVLAPRIRVPTALSRPEVNPRVSPVRIYCSLFDFEEWNEKLLEFNKISKYNSIKIYPFEIKKKTKVLE